MPNSAFRRTLERSLGEPDAVLDAYRAWQQTEDTGETEISREDMILAKHWIAAATRARNDGLQDFGESEAYFEVRMERYVAARR